jgi:hypothetical protein
MWCDAMMSCIVYNLDHLLMMAGTHYNSWSTNEVRLLSAVATSVNDRLSSLDDLRLAEYIWTENKKWSKCDVIPWAKANLNEIQTIS